MKFSIIIPTLNNASKLTICLEHLAKIVFSKENFEVLVIDNGCTDNTLEVILSFKNKIKNIQHFYCDVPGCLMAARHKGWRESHSPILCFIDDDSLVNPHWLNAMEDSFRNEEVNLVGGPCIPKYEIPPPSWVEEFWQNTEYGKFHGYLSLLDFGSQIIPIPHHFVFGCNYNIRKKALELVGGTLPDYLPETYKFYQGTGETGISSLLANHGIALYHPDVRIEHYVVKNRFTPQYFSNRAYYNGIGASYSEIRKSAFEHDSRTKMELKFLKKKMNQLKTNIKMLRLEKSEFQSVKILTSKKYHQGFYDHQQIAYKDEVLMSWICLDNYLHEGSNVFKFINNYKTGV